MNQIWLVFAHKLDVFFMNFSNRGVLGASLGGCSKEKKQKYGIVRTQNMISSAEFHENCV